MRPLALRPAAWLEAPGPGQTWLRGNLRSVLACPPGERPRGRPGFPAGTAAPRWLGESFPPAHTVWNSGDADGGGGKAEAARCYRRSPPGQLESRAALLRGLPTSALDSAGRRFAHGRFLRAILPAHGMLLCAASRRSALRAAVCDSPAFYCGLLFWPKLQSLLG